MRFWRLCEPSDYDRAWAYERRKVVQKDPHAFARQRLYELGVESMDERAIERARTQWETSARVLAAPTLYAQLDDEDDAR